VSPKNGKHQFSCGKLPFELFLGGRLCVFPFHTLLAMMDHVLSLMIILRRCQVHYHSNPDIVGGCPGVFVYATMGSFGFHLAQAS
jgi:hypothetical protein